MRLKLFEWNNEVNNTELSKIYAEDQATKLWFLLGSKLPPLQFSKLRSRKIKVGEHVFDSYSEAIYTLKFLEWTRGRGIDRESVHLQREFLIGRKNKYIADIFVHDPVFGSWVIDVKAKCKSTKVKDSAGRITQVARLKLSMLQDDYPLINIRIGWLEKRV